MPTGQMNVRIDDDIRIEGNAAFESVGWSPSQAAREVWAFAARNRRNPRKLREMRRFFEDEPTTKPKPSKAEEGARLVEEGLAKLGVNIFKHEPTSLEELKREAFAERWVERGLL